MLLWDKGLDMTKRQWAAIRQMAVVSAGVRLRALIAGAGIDAWLKCRAIGSTRSAHTAIDGSRLRADGELQLVPGYRDYDNRLAEGTRKHTGAGHPVGLRRAEDNIEYVQISAPVSSGSSGGGLFDDRGNLIGIVTFTIRDAQNLNFAIFAISASMFWRASNYSVTLRWTLRSGTCRGWLGSVHRR
jgi:hypothetical protein